MDPAGNCRGRHHYRWPKEARDLVADYLARTENETVEPASLRLELRTLVTGLVGLTGNSREACLRFARQLGSKTRQTYHEWTIDEQQRLLDLIAISPPHDVARKMHRSTGSIRAMLHRLGASAQMGRDWFTKFTLAKALHIRVTEVQRWVDQGWLPTRIVDTGALKKEIIDAAKFAEFCKQYRTAIIGRRLNAERLDFVRTYVFPPSHTDLLPVRDAKKERAAYEAQAGELNMDLEHEEHSENGELTKPGPDEGIQAADC